MDYHKRLKELNSGEKTVLDCIDRPIRPLVIELNRIGLATKWSCCGFNYKDEEEPKSHSKTMCFVVLKPIMNFTKEGPISIGNTSAFFALAECAMKCGWDLHPYSSTGEWHLHYRSDNENNFYGEGGIHNYEGRLIKIQALTKLLKHIPSSKKEFMIIDGNTMYDNMTDGEWQIEPKPSVVLNSEKTRNEHENSSQMGNKKI